MKAAKSKHRKFMKDGTHMELLIGTIWLLNSLSWLSVAEAKQMNSIELYWLYCILLHVIYKWQITYVILSNNYLPPYFRCLKRTISPANNH